MTPERKKKKQGCKNRKTNYDYHITLDRPSPGIGPADDGYSSNLVLSAMCDYKIFPYATSGVLAIVEERRMVA